MSEFGGRKLSATAAAGERDPEATESGERGWLWHDGCRDGQRAGDHRCVDCDACVVEGFVDVQQELAVREKREWAAVELIRWCREGSINGAERSRGAIICRERAVVPERSSVACVGRLVRRDRELVAEAAVGKLDLEVAEGDGADGGARFQLDRLLRVQGARETAIEGSETRQVDRGDRVCRTRRC